MSETYLKTHLSLSIYQSVKHLHLSNAAIHPCTHRQVHVLRALPEGLVLLAQLLIHLQVEQREGRTQE